MARIFYGVSGEGRGHATRARALIEDLRRRHEVVVYSFDQAFELLHSVYQGTEVDVRRLPGLQFAYGPGKRLDYSRSFFQGLPYLLHLPDLVQRLQRELEQDGADLVITDFEPALPRAAIRAGVPFLSLDHQHFLVACDLRTLPPSLQAYAAFMAPFIHAYYRGQVETMISSFFSAPLRQGYRDVVQIGTLLRPEIVQAPREHGDHLVAYVRRAGSERLIRALARSGQEVRVYGLGRRPSVGKVRFQEVDVFRFVEDLATCRALVTTAGNQLIGEALYLGKPVLGMPEEGNYEQRINAHFLRQSGMGTAVDIERIGSKHIRRFLRKVDELRERIVPDQFYGNPAAIAMVEAHATRTWYQPADAVSANDRLYELRGRYGRHGTAAQL